MERSAASTTSGKTADRERGNFAVSHKKGRPEAKIDPEAFERLAAFQCTQPEIAAILKVSVDTIQRRIANVPLYAGAWERGRENGKASLRRMQFASAQKGNVTMQIWLGKQYLGQRDKFESETTTKDGTMTLEQLLTVSARLLGEEKKKQ